MEKYLAAVVQLDTQESYEDNLKMAKELLLEGISRGAKLLALPENWTYQGDNYLDYAEEIPNGKTFIELAEIAKKHKVWISTGSYSEINKDDGTKPFNTSAIINPKGELKAKYRKIHAFNVDVEGGGSYRESDSKTAGKEIVVCDTTELGVLGLSICYDMRFPEIYRIMALEGAEILFAPSSFILMTGKDHWEPLLRARAIENSCYMLAAGQCGIKHDGPTYGKSLIIDPWGNVVAKASDMPSVITAEINLEYRRKVKKQVITLENRREDVYSLKRK